MKREKTRKRHTGPRKRKNNWILRTSSMGGKGNGKQLQRIYQKTTDGADGEVGEAEKLQTGPAETPETEKDMAKERWQKEIQDNYAAKWTTPDGNARRQIDYVANNAKYRKAERKAQRTIYGNSNMGGNQQHRVQTIHLFYNSANQYRKPTPEESVVRLKYGIQELRLRPANLTKWYQSHETNEKKKEIKAAQDWEDYKEKLGSTMGQ